MRPYAIVTGGFGRNAGMDLANSALAEFLLNAGNEVHLVAHKVDRPLAAHPHARLHLVPRPLNSTALGGPLLDLTGRYVGRQTSRRGGRVVVNGGNCRFDDVNWMHYVHAAYKRASSASLGHRFKSTLFNAHALRIERENILRSRAVIANSNKTRDEVILHYGASPDRVHTVYIGIDPEEFRPANALQRRALREELGWPLNRPVMLFVGSLGDRRKGFDILLSAWKAASRAPGWEGLLKVVGSGAELPRFRRAVDEDGLSAHVTFLGFRTDAARLMRAADGLVSPTRYDSFGLNVLEALCCGLPTLVSRQAGVSERYPPDFADLLLDDPEDVGKLSQALMRWQKEVEALRARVLPLSEKLRRYSWDDMAREIVRVMDVP